MEAPNFLGRRLIEGLIEKASYPVTLFIAHSIQEGFRTKREHMVEKRATNKERRKFLDEAIRDTYENSANVVVTEEGETRIREGTLTPVFP